MNFLWHWHLLPVTLLERDAFLLDSSPQPIVVKEKPGIMLLGPACSGDQYLAAVLNGAASIQYMHSEIVTHCLHTGQMCATPSHAKPLKSKAQHYSDQEQSCNAKAIIYIFLRKSFTTALAT